METDERFEDGLREITVESDSVVPDNDLPIGWSAWVIQVLLEGAGDGDVWRYRLPAKLVSIIDR